MERNESSALTEFIGWCKKERAILRRSLEMMESGVSHTGERHAGSPWRDTTAESIARVKSSIAELDEILERYRG